MNDPISNPVAAANTFAHLMILAIGLAMIAYDRRTPTTRALAASMALWGSEEIVRVWLRVLGSWPPGEGFMLLGWLPGYLSSIAAAEYLILVLATAPAPDRAVRAAQQVLRLNQVLMVLYLVLEYLMPERYLNYTMYGNVANGVGFDFWFFKTQELIGMFTLIGPVLVLVLRRVDFQEKRRVLALVCATPCFSLSAGFLPNGIIQVLALFVGLVIILVGATGYLVAQGRRGEFMSRFLSPAIRDRVQEQGMQRGLQQSQAEITIVCCDLRGFTAFAQAHPSETVIGILKEYYDAAGEVAAAHGATIKDFAGDGVLLLVGAPEPRADHARAGVELATALVRRAAAIVDRHGSAEHRLGVGAGVATGVVTVGVIDSKSRLEYAAVGSAVNLSARLCSVAAAGQVRVAQRTAELSGLSDLTALPAVSLKGMGEEIPNFAVAMPVGA